MATIVVQLSKPVTMNRARMAQARTWKRERSKQLQLQVALAKAQLAVAEAELDNHQRHTSTDEQTYWSFGNHVEDLPTTPPAKDYVESLWKFCWSEFKVRIDESIRDREKLEAKHVRIMLDIMTKVHLAAEVFVKRVAL